MNESTDGSNHGTKEEIKMPEDKGKEVTYTSVINKYRRNKRN